MKKLTTEQTVADYFNVDTETFLSRIDTAYFDRECRTMFVCLGEDEETGEHEAYKLPLADAIVILNRTQSFIRAFIKARNEITREEK